MILKITAGFFFILGLWYILAPGPTKITDIPALPDSLKSDEPGDTYQNPNNSAYFSQMRRNFVTDYYQNAFEELNLFGIKLPAIKLNHPPEEAYQYIRDQQRSTYLEQVVYPLRDSLFINGYEPFNEEGKKFDSSSVPIFIKGNYYETKTTLRLYHSNNFIRIFIYLGIWIAVYYWYKLFLRIFIITSKKPRIFSPRKFINKNV